MNRLIFFFFNWYLAPSNTTIKLGVCNNFNGFSNHSIDNRQITTFVETILTNNFTIFPIYISIILSGTKKLVGYNLVKWITLQIIKRERFSFFLILSIQNLLLFYRKYIFRGKTILVPRTYVVLKMGFLSISSLSLDVIGILSFM